MEMIFMAKSEFILRFVLIFGFGMLSGFGATILVYALKQIKKAKHS